MKNFFKKFSSYSFWVSFSGAILILLNAFGKAFGFSVENQVVEDCIMAIAGVLVVLGVVGNINKNDEDESITSGEIDGDNNISDNEDNFKEIDNENKR